MFLTKGFLATILLVVVFVSISLALPYDDDPSSLAAEPDEGNKRVGRILLPANFAVKKKKFTIGKLGVTTFFGAWRNCIAEGKGLATIDTREEQQYLEAMLESTDAFYWIAATNLGNPRFSLTWITTDLPVRTTPFDLRLTGPTCIALKYNGLWTKNNCFSTTTFYPYLCEAYY
uniref:C-type lectin domain-containing protein n=1 Tax=Anopheles culicifacies TaxID=139723 RepID=A0A182MR30_9DIPT